jgi:hypothetical protein
MRMFTQSSEGEARRWFRDLETNSINSWIYYHNIFLHKWVERKSHHQYLSKFYTIKRRNDETVTRFNRIFENTYHNLHVDIRPYEAIAKVYYTLAFHLGLSFYLRERKSLIQVDIGGHPPILTGSS